MQISVDGYVCGPNGELDWMTWDWDDQLKHFVGELTTPVSTILLGRKLAEGFIPHWRAAAEADKEDLAARKFSETPSVVFSKTLEQSLWDNATLASGELSDEINRLKNQSGGDIIVYGGASFASALIELALIDELYLFVNPIAVGQGKPIFTGKTALKLVASTVFDCGIVVNQYQPA